MDLNDHVPSDFAVTCCCSKPGIESETLLLGYDVPVN